ncbi:MULTISPECIES: NUDIX domain-containing protein [Gemella]|uniref:NUDIX domain-containing protein n=1 Tax=Gemella TaxID=1378 RepID=UPI0007681049|nr:MULTISPECIES: NUDIX domain-containing protein [Gemella]AME09052.1 DNA mismatch repair protein MutT [Gemella sp. oral taxon 928]AXI26624.1 NUDIX domain-containing protein [Gemella sp. ND 6198]
MSKWDEQILVVKREILFNNEENDFYGFLPKEDEKVKKIVDTFEHYEVKRRGDMEENPKYKQLIGYVLVKDKITKEVLVYRRLVGGGEARLHGKASVGIGGHMNEVAGKTIYEMLKVNAARELNEEVGVDEDYALKNLHFVGLINDDKEVVGQVHVGVVYTCEVDKDKVEVKENDTLVIKWDNTEEARAEENYETWSAFLKPIM